jgi:Proton-conducting membrane transporter/NADH-Ubiquinone oxidoreductase (complex I), chain 5 N-terminus
VLEGNASALEGNEARQVQVNSLVVVPIAVLVAGVALQALLARILSAAAKGWLALGVTSCSAVAALWPAVWHGHVLGYQVGAWDGPVRLSFHVDGLGLLFALMATGIGAAILLYSVGYLATDAAATRFYMIMQVFVAGLILLVFAEDLLVMYAGWELVGLCSFLLVGFWYTDPEAAAGARKVLVMTHGAGYALLAAILVLHARTGTTLWTDPRVGRAFTTRCVRAHARGRRGEVGPVPAAHLDPLRDGGPDTGQRVAARRRVRQGGRLPGRPDALARPVAVPLAGLGRVAGHGHHARRRPVRHDPA